MAKISNIKSLSNYFKKLEYPTSTEGLQEHLENMDSELFEKLREIDGMLKYFTNEQII